MALRTTIQNKGCLTQNIHSMDQQQTINQQQNNHCLRTAARAAGELKYILLAKSVA